MRAGKLDRQIELMSFSEVGNELGGNPLGGTTGTWQTYDTVRAELVEVTSDETARDSGQRLRRKIVFRIRWHAVLSLTDRVAFEETDFRIRSIKEIERRRGLELTCEEIAS